MLPRKIGSAPRCWHSSHFATQGQHRRNEVQFSDIRTPCGVAPHQKPRGNYEVQCLSCLPLQWSGKHANVKIPRFYVITLIFTPGSLLAVSSRPSYLSRCLRATPCFRLQPTFRIAFYIQSWPAWVSRHTLRWTTCCRASTQPKSQGKMGLLHKVHRSTTLLFSSWQHGQISGCTLLQHDVFANSRPYSPLGLLGPGFTKIQQYLVKMLSELTSGGEEHGCECLACLTTASINSLHNKQSLVSVVGQRQPSCVPTTRSWSSATSEVSATYTTLLMGQRTAKHGTGGTASPRRIPT